MSAASQAAAAQGAATSASASASASSDPYSAFYYWDYATNQWAFDYDAYYRTYGYPEGYSAAGTSAGAAASGVYGVAPAAYANAGAAAATGAYDLQAGPLPTAPDATAVVAGTPGAPGAESAGASTSKAKKKAAGPKDAEGNPIAGQLKRGEKRATVLRSVAGKLYEDQTLLEWDPSHRRLFVGDLGNDVTDPVLAKAFEKYPSFSKARVVRKKHDGKSKGYGFVAFADPEDFLRAWKEMNGKYIGSRPCRLKKAENEVAPTEIGYRKDRLLANNAKYDEFKAKYKMGSAIGATLRRQGGVGAPYKLSK